MPTLTKDTRCPLCGRIMKAGEPFRWHKRSARHVAKGVKGVPARFVPACEDTLCAIRERDAEQAAHDARVNDLAAQMADAIRSGADPVEAARKLGII